MKKVIRHHGSWVKKEIKCATAATLFVTKAKTCKERAWEVNGKYYTGLLLIASVVAVDELSIIRGCSMIRKIERENISVGLLETVRSNLSSN